MPQFNVSAGATLTFTTKIPTDVMEALVARDGENAALPLTPALGQVPELPVRKLRKAGVEVASRWNDEDVVVPLIHGQSFYITGIDLGGGALSFSMKGVNLRTGLAETDGPVTDKPCQSFWAPGLSLPWIDGYVPGTGDAVRQFVPLRGETEMAADVARHVGISDEDPYIDALRGRFFLPKEIKPSGWRGAYDDDIVLESLNVPMGGSVSKGGAFESMRGARPRGAVAQSAPVGMGAGIRMRQRHEHNPFVSVDDFRPTPWLEIVFRLVWLEEWNTLAKQIDVPVITDERIESLKREQIRYETNVRRDLGIFTKVDTNVDAFPPAP